jgi:hypothetical protein
LGGQVGLGDEEGDVLGDVEGDPCGPGEDVDEGCVRGACPLLM